MTPKEAFEYSILRRRQLMSLDSVSVLDSHKELEFISCSCAALQKLIPMKPKKVTITEVFDKPVEVNVCPACGHDLLLCTRHCTMCGQAIKEEE